MDAAEPEPEGEGQVLGALHQQDLKAFSVHLRMLGLIALLLLLTAANATDVAGDQCLDQLTSTCHDFRHAHACCGVCKGVDAHGVPVVPPKSCTLDEIRGFCHQPGNNPDGTAGLAVDINPHTYELDPTRYLDGNGAPVRPPSWLSAVCSITSIHTSSRLSQPPYKHADMQICGEPVFAD